MEEKVERISTDAEPEEFVPSEEVNHEEESFQEAFSPQDAQFEEVPTKSPAPVRKNEATTTKLAQMMMFQHDAIPPSKYNSMKEMTEDFWLERKRKMNDLKEEEMRTKSRNMSVPMARVKKIMRIDDDVRNFMIASDAPIFMAQAAEFFIEEMTAMGWQYVSEARRRILQKTDIATAVHQNDQFDFLIDFLPPKTEKSPAAPPFNYYSAPGTSTRKPTEPLPTSFQRSTPSRIADFNVPSTSAGPSTPSTSSDHVFVAPTAPGASRQKKNAAPRKQ